MEIESDMSDRKVVLNYTMPFLPDNITVGKEGVLPIVQDGGPTCTIDRTFTLTFSLAT